MGISLEDIADKISSALQNIDPPAGTDVSSYTGEPPVRRSRPRRAPAASGDRLRLRDHAAASVVAHLPHAADRLASTRARRAAAARAVRSAGTASPLAKYISSGVCPRNAEWGSTWLCC